MKIRFEYVVIVTAVAAVLLFTLLLGQGPRKPGEEAEKKLAGQSRASTQLGVRALYSVLAAQGATVQRLERRYELIPEDVEVLAVVAPHDEPDGAEIDAITRWIERGGTLLFFPSPATPKLTAGLGWTLEPGTAEPTTCRARMGAESYQLKISTQARLVIRPTILRDAVPLAEDDLGVVASEATLGRGRVIAICDPAIAGNDLLDEEDHAAFLVHLMFRHAPRRRIAFDEYHHGWTGGQSLTGYVMSSPMGWAVIQVLAVLLLFTIGRNRRLGPPREVYDERRRKPQEFIEAFARLCRKSGSRRLALDLVFADVRDAVTRRFGACDRATIEREANRKGRDGVRLSAGFEEARRPGISALSTGALLRHQRLLDEVRALTR